MCNGIMETLSKEELVSLVERIIRAEDSEQILDSLIEKLSCSVSDPNVIDYIYWHTPELSAIEVVEKALAYKPIIL